ncbi:MAG: hemolysin family protein [Bryobacteraceae bacterium]
MTAVIALILFLSALLLVLVTLVQMLYMESARLRSRDLPSLQFFKDTIEERIGLKVEAGVLTFSLVKHGLLVFMGVLFMAISTMEDSYSKQGLIEAMMFGWITMLISSYLVPQTLYRYTSGGWLALFVPILTGLAVVVRPLTALLAFLHSLAQLGSEEAKAEEAPTSAENIEALISAGTEEGIIEEDDRRLIQSVVAFGDKTVREVMTARPNIVAISADSTLDDLRRLVINEQFSRIPVYEESIDDVIGFVHVRDMFELEHGDRSHRTVRELARPVRLVPETKPVNDLLREMQRDGAHMAIVVDEYGNTAGLATMEDMVEEILGEIRDEHEPTLDVEQDSEGRFIVSGSFNVDQLNDLIGYRTSESIESTTVGGLVSEWLGRVPRIGESIERDGVRIEVLAGNDLRVDQVRISKLPPEKMEAES